MCSQVLAKYQGDPSADSGTLSAQSGGVKGLKEVCTGMDLVTHRGMLGLISELKQSCWHDLAS